MSMTSETLVVLIFLIPGFLSSFILNAVLVRKDKGAFWMVVEALAFTLPIYVAVRCFTSETPISFRSSEVGGVAVYTLHFSWKALSILLVAAVALPLIVGASVTHDWHMRLLRTMRVTNKTARSTLWQDVFTDQRGM